MCFKVCKYTGVFKKRMLEVIKMQRDTKNFTLYRIVLLRVISVMNIFPHSITPLKVVDHILRPNAPFSFLDFIFFLAVPTSKIPFQIAP